MYRDSLEIVRDILVVAGERGSKKTHIMYGANLSYKLVQHYLQKTIKAGLLVYDGKANYVITERGKAFLEIYNDYKTNYLEVESKLNLLEKSKLNLEKMLKSDNNEEVFQKYPKGGL